MNKKLLPRLVLRLDVTLLGCLWCFLKIDLDNPEPQSHFLRRDPSTPPHVTLTILLPLTIQFRSLPIGSDSLALVPFYPLASSLCI